MPFLDWTQLGQLTFVSEDSESCFWRDVGFEPSGPSQMVSPAAFTSGQGLVGALYPAKKSKKDVIFFKLTTNSPSF